MPHSRACLQRVPCAYTELSRAEPSRAEPSRAEPNVRVIPTDPSPRPKASPTPFDFRPAEQVMGTLVINDLPESVELDRQAMAAIVGGSMVLSHQTMLAPRPNASLRIGTAAGVMARTPIADAVAQRTRITLLR